MLAAQAAILPGVGAAADTMVNLQKLGLVSPIRRFIAEGRPFLGICIGLQILFSGTEEGGWHECLDIIPGIVRRLPRGLKIPHMGWNQVRQRIHHPIFNGIPDEANFYFVHSYYVEPHDRSIVVGETEYGAPICSVTAKGNLIATQFHPEKSGEFGLKIYDNFIKTALGAKIGRLQHD
jgi:glutamine amidotransferase